MLRGLGEALADFQRSGTSGKKPTFMIRKSNAANLWQPTQEGPYVANGMDFGTAFMDPRGAPKASEKQARKRG